MALVTTKAILPDKHAGNTGQKRAKPALSAGRYLHFFAATANPRCNRCYNEWLVLAMDAGKLSHLAGLFSWAM